MMRPTRKLRLVAVLIATGSLAACSSTSDGAAPPPTTTTTTTGFPEPQELLDAWAAGGDGGVAIAIAGSDEDVQVLAAGTDGPDGAPIGPDAAFRVGSLSKTFVAVMILQVVTDGAASLEDPVTQHLPDLDIDDGITVRHLLAHRSGLPEHTDSELAPAVLADPARTWTPTDVLALVIDQPLDFPPGTEFAYSNTNYVVAGLLLEQVTGRSLADNLRTRIVDPLGLTDTYFAPDADRTPIGGFSASLPGGNTDGASYRALETASGAAGALVSTASDLATFIRALAHGALLDEVAYAEMTAGLPDEGHSLGVVAADPPNGTGIANAGAIPGYTAYMQYDPATEDLFVLLLNDDTRNPEELAVDLLATSG